MRRVTMLLAAMAVMVTLFAGVALAAAIEGTSAGEILIESDRNDTMFGRGGRDEVDAGAFGPNGFLLDTDPERDVANGNGGNDVVFVDDGDGRDTANGGRGNDVCFSDPNDELISCEEENP
jgi:Ca2+-binding RTX toxin-like protein